MALAASPAMPASPGQVQLHDLLRVCRTGDHVTDALLKEMLGLFIADNGRRIDLARQAARSGDHLALRGAVHAIKGSAALIGATRLRDLAGDLELRVVSGTARNAESATEIMREEFAAVVKTLHSLYPDISAA